MEINQNNDFSNKITELNNKYEILEKQCKGNKELLENNKTNILILNKSLRLLNDSFKELQNKYDKDIEELKDKVKTIIKENKENQKVKNNQINIEQINNLKIKYDEMFEDINKRFEYIKNEIRSVKIKNVELKIDENKGDNYFQVFQNLLAKIIDKKEIDTKSYEELKRLSEQLMKFDISPTQYANDFIKANYKYTSKDIEHIKDEDNNIFVMQRKIIESLAIIEDEIRQKNATPVQTKKEQKAVDPYIENFRKKYSISIEDASDEEIKKFLKKYKYKELDTVRALMDNILDKKNKK